MSAVPVKLIRFVTAAPDRRGLEALRLRDDPRGHEAAVAPAHDAESIRVGDAHPDHVIDAGHEVAVVAAAPVAVVGVAERLAVAAAAARVDAQHGVAARRERRDRIRAWPTPTKLFTNTPVGPPWTTSSSGTRVPALVPDGIGEHALDRRAVRRLPRRRPRCARAARRTTAARGSPAPARAWPRALATNASGALSKSCDTKPTCVPPSVEWTRHSRGARRARRAPAARPSDAARRRAWDRPRRLADEHAAAVARPADEVRLHRRASRPSGRGVPPAAGTTRDRVTGRPTSAASRDDRRRRSACRRARTAGTPLRRPSAASGRTVASATVDERDVGAGPVVHPGVG